MWPPVLSCLQQRGSGAGRGDEDNVLRSLSLQGETLVYGTGSALAATLLGGCMLSKLGWVAKGGGSREGIALMWGCTCYSEQEEI